MPSNNYFGGHVSIGRVTIYGRNAMHWAVNIRTRRGYLCFRLPFRCFGRWWPLYIYWSFNATPQGASWGVGKEGYTWQDLGLKRREWVTQQTRGYQIMLEVQGDNHAE